MEGNSKEIEHYIYMRKMATRFQWFYFSIGVAGTVFCPLIWGCVIVVLNIANIVHLEKRKNKYKHIIGKLVIKDMQHIINSATKQEQEIIKAFVKENYGDADNKK